jgi:chromosome partitioning protein
MIISIASQKGGPGKSTTAVNLCACLAMRGETPLLIDADEQTTTSDWCAGRSLSHPDAPNILLRQELGEIDELLEQLNPQHKFIIVDSAGHASVEMRSSFAVCDIMLIPFRPSQADLNTLIYMNDVVKRAKLINPSMVAYAFINQAPTNINAKHTTHAKEFISQFPDISLLNSVVGYRQIYMDSIAEGLGVVEMPSSEPSDIKAREEITALVDEVCNGN